MTGRRGGTRKTSGCERCRSTPSSFDDLAIVRVRLLWDSSHSSFELTRCESCRQGYLKQFHEILDWSGGEDDIWVRWMPLTAGEAAKIEAIPEFSVARGNSGELWSRLEAFMHRRERLVYGPSGRFHWDSNPWDTGDMMPPG